jgi:hypothetical protein
MPLRGLNHKTYEPGTHYSQASSSVVFPYLQVTKAATPSARFGVPENRDKNEGPVSPPVPRVLERPVHRQEERNVYGHCTP